MHVTFNAKERTLSEITALALSAGWEVERVTMASGGGGFAYILAKPCELEGSFEGFSQEEGDQTVDSAFSHVLAALAMEQRGDSVSMIESVSVIGSESTSVGFGLSPTMPTFDFRPPTPFDMPILERPENPVGRSEDKGTWDTLKKKVSSSFLKPRIVKFQPARGGEGSGSGGSSASDSEGEVVLGSHHLGMFHFMIIKTCFMVLILMLV